MNQRTAVPVIAVLMLAIPVHAAEIERTLTADGSCERLVIAGEDLTSQCGTALVQLHFADGRIAVSAGTGGQDWFGLGEPERMLLFYGPGVKKDWSDHAVDQVVVGREAVTVRQAVGTCTYAEAPPGLLVTCDATDEVGDTNALTYRTDGMPGFSF